MTALHYAASYNMLTAIEFLIKNGAEIDAKDRYGMTALHHCASSDARAVAEFLMQNGASMNVLNRNKWTPLHFAVLNNAKQLVSLLLESNINPISRDIYGNTPIKIALAINLKEIAALLRLQCNDIIYNNNDKTENEKLEQTLSIKYSKQIEDLKQKYDKQINLLKSEKEKESSEFEKKIELLEKKLQSSKNSLSNVQKEKQEKERELTKSTEELEKNKIQLEETKMVREKQEKELRNLQNKVKNLDSEEEFRNLKEEINILQIEINKSKEIENDLQKENRKLEIKEGEAFAELCRKEALLKISEREATKYREALDNKQEELIKLKIENASLEGQLLAQQLILNNYGKTLDNLEIHLNREDEKIEAEKKRVLEREELQEKQKQRLRVKKEKQEKNQAELDNKISLGKELYEVVTTYPVDMEVVRTLTERHGINLGHIDKSTGMTALHKAVLSGKKDLVGLLLTIEEKNIDCSDKNGFTPMWHALWCASAGSAKEDETNTVEAGEIVELLYRERAKIPEGIAKEIVVAKKIVPDKLLELSATECESAFLVSEESQLNNIYRKLKDKHKKIFTNDVDKNKVNKLTFRDKKGNTALHIAAKNGPVFHFLLSELSDKRWLFASDKAGKSAWSLVSSEIQEQEKTEYKKAFDKFYNDTVIKLAKRADLAANNAPPQKTEQELFSGIGFIDTKITKALSERLKKDDRSNNELPNKTNVLNILNAHNGIYIDPATSTKSLNSKKVDPIDKGSKREIPLRIGN